LTGSLDIHRTYRARDGADEVPVNPTRMMLGSCNGAVARLAQPDASRMIGEIKTKRRIE
jgi:hypothetical protein